MTWSIALGNLNPAPQAAAPIRAVKPNKPTKPTRKLQPTLCPHCGQRMRNPDGPRPWSPEDDDILLDRLEASTKLDAIASELGRPISSIRSRINTLRLKKEPSYGK